MRKHVFRAGLAGLIAGLIVATPAPAPAQQKGSWEVGGFGRYTDYDKSYEIARQSANGYGGGGRLGYFFSRNLAVEADGSGNWTDVIEFFTGYQSTALSYYPFHLRLMFNQRFGDEGPVSWFIGAGPAYNRYGKQVEGEPGFRGDGFGSDWALSGITGFRLHLSRALALRVDGTVDYVMSPNNGKDAVTTQFAGIGGDPATKNLNLGAQAGLSLLLGTCSKAADGTTIAPTSASIQTGGSASFSATATHCGKPDAVVFSVSGPGSVDGSGRYTSSTAGTATVMACGLKNRLCSTASVTVTPPPPPVTVTACELAPATATTRIDQPVNYTLTRVYSDGRREPVAGFGLQSTGGSVSGSSLSWSTPGAKTVTATAANCPPAGASAAVEVQQPISIVVHDSAYFEFDKTTVYQSADQTRLNELARILREHPGIRLVIDGHADADGTVKYNDGLGMRRAQAVLAYLRGAGIPVDQMAIEVRSFGECQPMASNQTAEGRALNRRAEIHEVGNSPYAQASASCAEAGRSRRP